MTPSASALLRPTILLLDDSPGDRFIFKEAMGDRRCQLIEATTIENAWRELQAGEVNLLVLEESLPVEGGIAFVRRLKAHPRTASLPIIMLSAGQSSRVVREAYGSGISCFVQKPRTLDEYIGMVQICMDFWCERAVLPKMPSEP